MKQPIRIYNSFMNLLHETDKYISLRIVPKFYEIGEFELHVSQYIEGAEYFQKGNVIIPNKRGDKAMLIRHREIALDESGKASENWKITGVTLDGLLDQRITVPPSDTGYDRKKGNAETVMKHYVYNHFVNPTDSTRRIDHIEIAPNLNRGIEISWESRYKNVADEIVSISKQANLGFVIYADMTLKKWIFDVVEPRNLTKDNPGGLPPVFFSPDFQTIKNQLFVDSDLNLKNVGYVGGQGEGTERKVVKVGQGVGLQRKETFIDARDVGNPEDEEELTEEEMEELLVQRGEEKMREFLTNFYLEAQILTPTINDHSGRFALRSPFEYEVDFRLGDVVEVFNKNWNITMDAPITEFTEIYEANGFLLEATFGEAQPTLITKIKNKFDDIEGVEKQEFPVKVAVEQMKQAIQYSDEKLSEEEKKRIEQAMGNLEIALSYTKEYAEKKRVESKTAPSDTEVIWIDTSNPNNIIWKVWNGSDWVAGPSGPQGIQGPPGDKGEPLYTWLKYADDAEGNGMSDSPDGKPYMGIAYNKQSPNESTNPLDYEWSKIEGPQGPNRVDKDTTFGDKWLLASHIESLNGLIVGQGQFVVDADGNVSFAGDLVGASGTFGEVTVKNGDFKLEDDITNMKYSTTPKRNLIRDHSFELVKTDPDSFNSSSVRYNWIDMRSSSVQGENHWVKAEGSPKVSIMFAPDSVDAIPVFGEQAISVRNTDYVYQIVWNGIGASGEYTLSGHFKRQWNVVGGGSPRFEVWHIDGMGNEVGKILDKTFPAVGNDYSIKRHAASFTVPTNYSPEDSLKVKISSGNSEWVQCDGVQMVEGDIPSVYQSEDATFLMADGGYEINFKQNRLWSGAIYPLGSHTVVPLKPLADCRNGWILEFKSYTPGQGAENSNFQYSYIPKSNNLGNGHRLNLARGVNMIEKYIYIHNDRIVGNDVNGTSPNNTLVLSTVYEF
ncbi:hypothetical protein MKX83_18595 [Cytobacillus sp. FSL M8-0252]|uniref:Gp37-like protein n=1 Tax=Cytobacillus sp. FSL M8-0252 TaxID=2921621 RepID=UPI0030FBD51F